MFHSNKPLEQAETLPSCWYLDKEVYEKELKTIFLNTWQLVGRLDQLTPGSFITNKIVDEPILVINESGLIRAMSNVCRHKGTILKTEPCGQVSTLRCPYHGWTYSLDGKLLGTPEFNGVKNFCKEDNGLPQLMVDKVDPMVFVKMNNDICISDPDIFYKKSEDRSLELLRKHLPSLSKMKYHSSKTYHIACNWKVFVDNYLDGGYHINYVHPGLAESVVYSEYKTEIEEHVAVQSSPLNDATELRAGMARYIWMFPNLMLNIYNGLMDTNLVIPTGPTSCKVIFDFYFEDATSDKDYANRSISLSDKIQIEDMIICEQVQEGLKSRLYSTGRFSVKREMAGYHFQKMVYAYASMS